MSKPQFSLNESDMSLRNSGRRVNHPSECGALNYNLPADITGLHVVAAYPDDDDQSREKISCALCGHKKNHRKGVVLALPDGTFAPIGRHCCKKKLGHEHQALIDAFDSDDHRKESLRRLLLAIDSIEGVLDFLDSLKADRRLQVLRDLRDRFSRKFGKLYDAAAAARGRLILERTIQDEKATTDRRRARDRKANGYIALMEAETGNQPSLAEVEAHFAGDHDFSKLMLTMTEKYEFNTVPATYFFTGLQHVERDIDIVAGALIKSLAQFDGRNSSEFDKARVFADAVAAFERGLKSALGLIAKINDAMALFGATGDIRKIVGWANLNHAVNLGGGGKYGLEAGAVSYRFGDNRTPYRVEFQVMESLPIGHLPALLAQLRPGSNMEAAEVA